MDLGLNRALRSLKGIGLVWCILQKQFFEKAVTPITMVLR